MSSMIVFFANAYPDIALQRIFGKIPTCFLPMHGKKLYEKLVEGLDFDEKVFFIPDDYTRLTYAEHDRALANGITFVSIPSSADPLEAAQLARKYYQDNNYFDRADVITTASITYNGYNCNNLNQYNAARINGYSTRSFNKISYSHHSGVLTKTSTDQNKIEAEANWYENLPFSLRAYTPIYYGRVGDYGYMMENLPFTTLADSYVYGNLDVYEWRDRFDLCLDFIKDCNGFNIVIDDSNIGEIHKNKTLKRFEDYLNSIDDKNVEFKYYGFTLPPIPEIIKELSANIVPIFASSIVHGDFCFSNILYDHWERKIRVIDPRGLSLTGEKSVYGDYRYDLAKLAHSIIGMYDHIIAGEYDLYSHGINNDTIAFRNRRFDVAEAFENIFGSDSNWQSIMSMMILQFFAMLPLHADNPKRQKALLINALRLYVEMNY